MTAPYPLCDLPGNNNTSEDVFRASSQRDETRGAETIAEGGETEVEKPVDQEEAEEVAEEEEDGVNEVEPVKRAKVLCSYSYDHKLMIKI